VSPAGIAGLPAASFAAAAERSPSYGLALAVDAGSAAAGHLAEGIAAQPLAAADQQRCATVPAVWHPAAFAAGAVAGLLLAAALDATAAAVPPAAGSAAAVAALLQGVPSCERCCTEP